jgi:type 1 glutamine amidotransferase
MNGILADTSYLVAHFNTDDVHHERALQVQERFMDGEWDEIVVITRSARDREHPIMRGLPEVWMQAHDELYYHLRGPIGEMHVLATAQPPNGEHAPILWTMQHGDGRVFVTTLGHHIPSVESLGFMTTLVRGMEWAATGQVTIPVPANFPGAYTPVREAPVFE